MCSPIFGPQKARMRSLHAGSPLPSFPLRQRQQLPFPCALGGCPSLRLQPPAEVLHPHRVLDGRLLDAHLQLRQSSPISSTQISPRRMPSACATASYSDSAVTSTACSVPAKSRQETRQERRAMRRRVTCFAISSPTVFYNPGGRSLTTPKFRSSASPAHPSVPSSNSRPISVTPCGTRRGGENFGSGALGSGAQSLRASGTSTKPARNVSEGCPVKLVMVSISSRSEGTSNRSTWEKTRAISTATLRRNRSA